MSIDLKSLIGKLNPICSGAMESAAGLCIALGHYEVDIEHVLIKLLEVGDTDLLAILRHYDFDEGRFERDLNNTLA